MGLQDWIRNLRAPRIMATPAEAWDFPVSLLDTYGVEGMLGITVSLADVPVLFSALEAAGSGASSRLTSPDARPVTFIPSRDPRQVPALDPNDGWLVPITAQNAELITRTISTSSPGEWEFSELGVGIVVVAG